MLSIGSIDLPKGWDQRVELTLTEPEQTGLAVPLAGKAKTERPRANITITRGSTGITDAKEALDAFLAHFARFAPNLKRSAEGPLQFADGARGFGVTLSFDPEPGVSVVQRHVYRVDSGVITHLTASVEAAQATKMDATLAPLLVTYRP